MENLETQTTLSCKIQNKAKEIKKKQQGLLGRPINFWTVSILLFCQVCFKFGQKDTTNVLSQLLLVFRIFWYLLGFFRA